MKLSVVISVYNERDNIKPLLSSLSENLSGINHEIIIVDDGSIDGTLEVLKREADANTRVIEFMRNFGQSLALAAGIDNAAGEYICTMDGDMQNDPSDIVGMLKLAEEGQWDLVAGIRDKRKDAVFKRRFPSYIANFIIGRTTDVRIKDYGCTLKIFRNVIAKNLGLYGEMHRFIPILASLQGARITQVPVKHNARRFGKSKYGMGRIVKVMSDLLLLVFFQKYRNRPMHLFGGLGLGIFLIGALINLYMLVVRITGTGIWGRPLLLLGILFTISGLQIVTVGILLEMITRTYYESQNKKPYAIRMIHTFENKNYRT